MDELLNRLDEIYKVLEQIHAITMNQTTVLLESSSSLEEENEALDMIDSMVEYKDELINEVNAKEAIFEKSYEKYRGKIKDKVYVEAFKKHVGRILTIKQNIVDAERNNILVMQNIAKKREKPMDIKPSAGEAVAAYKKQQIKS